MTSAHSSAMGANLEMIFKTELCSFNASIPAQNRELQHIIDSDYVIQIVPIWIGTKKIERAFTDAGLGFKSKRQMSLSYEGAEVKWDILCPTRDVPDRTSCPRRDVPSGTSYSMCPDRDVPSGTSRLGHDVLSGMSRLGHNNYVPFYFCLFVLSTDKLSEGD